MFLLDTNILSEMMSAATSEAVADWLKQHQHAELVTCSVCEGEIRYGISRLPHGHKRRELERAANTIFQTFLPQHILPYDSAAAHHYATLRFTREKLGKPAGLADLMIAAIAKAHCLTLVTRNSRDFDGLDLPIINPWEE